MTRKLYLRFMDRPRVAPQVIDFGKKFEGVLEHFTERMLGINDYIPLEKRVLLNKLFDLCGYDRSIEIYDDFGYAPDKFPI